MSHPIESLQEWFEDQIDGTWEHQRGIKIETLDNPGWSFEADLCGTSLEGAVLDRVDVTRTEDDWLTLMVEEGTFKGFGGPHNLDEIVQQFLAWAKTSKP